MIVHNKGNYIRHIGSAVLVPGTNDLDEKQAKSFKEALKVPLNQKLIDLKEIEVVGGLGETQADHLSDLKVEDALSLVVDSYNLESLEKWLDEENSGKKRKTLVAAIENQIEDIKNPNPDNIVDPNE